MSDRADSMLTFDLRAFARDYAGTPFGSRCKTAADELDRLYEVERRAAAALQSGRDEAFEEAAKVADTFVHDDGFPSQAAEKIARKIRKLSSQPSRSATDERPQEPGATSK